MSTQNRLELTLKPKRITLILIAIVLALTLIHSIGQIARFHFGLDTDNRYIARVLHEFHLTSEGNIPSFYASFALLLSSLLLAIIAFAKRRIKAPFTRYWFGMAVIFLYLAFDEMVELHESFIRPMRSLLDTSGFLYFAWVIPFSILLIIFLVTYLRFILNLPRTTRTLFIVAGALFVMGAIGLELLGGRQAEILKMQGSGSGALVTFQTIEELLEMTGIVIFIHALTSYLASELGQLYIRFRSPSVEQ